jgi:hypothetical protein
MTKSSVFDEAVFAHSQWKHRLRQAIEKGTSEWSVAEAKADDRCEFGKWLDRLPTAEKTSAHYSDLTSSHAEFHRAAAEVLALALSGKQAEARDAMAPGSRFRTISTKLVLQLSDMAKREE